MTRRSTAGWLAAAMLLVTLPLLWPVVPPLVDMAGHIGRYHIAAELANSPELQRHWTYRWALIGNLGVDLPAIALARWIGAEAAAKLVVLTIPASTVLGLWLLARVRARTIPPLAGFAFALAYGQAFQMGFVNFALAEALALIALAGWIGLAERPLLRAVLCVPVAWILWTAHSSGWGMFGLTAWATDVALRRGRGSDWRGALIGATLACLPLALPMLAMIGHGGGGVEWTVKAKAAALVSLLRDRWKWFDITSAIIVVALAWSAVRRPDWRIDPVLGAAGAILFVAFLALPRLAMDGAYVDMRMLAPACAIWLMAARIEGPAGARLFAAGMLFLTVRMIATAASFLLYADAQTQAAGAIAHIPRGSAVLVLVNEPCASTWHSDRLGHIGGIAVARRNIFENGQWAIPGQQLLGLKPPFDARYHADPSQLVYPGSCEYRPTVLVDALNRFDRGRYSHVWLVGFANTAVPGDLALRYRDERSALYAVSARSALAAHPRPPLWTGDAGG